MAYTQDGFKPYDERTTAQGARQQEGKAPSKFVDEENQLKQATEGANITNQAGFNPAASTVSQASQASQASKASLGPVTTQATNVAARTMKPANTINTGGGNPNARMAMGSTGGQKTTQAFMNRFRTSTYLY
jgi:hypothetical protein